ncbi:MAG TPA: response regulator transcription factor [Methylomirabilota bacterium]|nr:response regulator transcription factor [Methylomirabilota bacterium]
MSARRRRKTVVLADDQSIVRAGLTCFLGHESEFDVIGETGDGLRATRLIQRLKPDVVIIDVSLPGLHGLEVARRVREVLPFTGVVMLSRFAGPEHAVEAFRNGVNAYVVKQASPVELLRALRNAAAGTHFISTPLSRMKPLTRWLKEAASREQDPYDTLTNREREILQLVAEGFTSATIGRRLSISPRTAEAHRAAVLRKLHLGNQTAVFRYALARGVVPAPERVFPGMPLVTNAGADD